MSARATDSGTISAGLISIPFKAYAAAPAKRAALKRPESPATGELEIVEFVPEETIDHTHLHGMRYLGAREGADRAYALIAEGMRRKGLVAVGRFSSRGTEDIVLLRPHGDGLTMQRVYYADEVRPGPEISPARSFTFRDIETQLADKIIEGLRGEKFEPERYRDDAGRARCGTADEGEADQEAAE